jgi:hypothetical protein
VQKIHGGESPHKKKHDTEHISPRRGVRVE